MKLQEEIKKVIRDVPDFPKPGIIFKDITPIFYDQKLCSKIVDEFIARFDEKPDAIVGIESRGFLFGFLVANKLDIPFVLVRKAGKLPYKTVSVEYDLEYGTSKIEMHEDALQKGWNVIIHDDLLATGGTAGAAGNLVKKLGANVLGFNFVIGLDFLNGKQKLINHSNNITCLVHF
ncbi:MAG: adenine phosphoribosyltransferase [Bacteroidota bacterium]|nr:adenine phosphoribosyltransferase [Bacteroidota bacterium]MDP3146493.1 adenine phosphoribosyltransferase [Bacteroidota bacterium]